MRKIAQLLMLSGFGLSLLACHNSSSNSATTSSTASKKFRVALCLDKGGRDDKSFNASAYRGALRARDQLGIELRQVEVTDSAQVEPTLKDFAERGYDLVIGIGFAQQESLDHAAKANPKTHFAIVDAVVNQPNVASLMFMEHQGSYLAGALAVMKSKSKTIGFIGGMDVPLIRRFELGYREGAKHQDKKVKVLSNYVGVTGEAWNDPTKAKELALVQMAEGADVIFHAAGSSGLGVFDAVEEESKKGHQVYAIGVDSNQNWVKPGLILTSMLKRVDNAVFDTIQTAKQGQFVAGRHDYGLNNLGIDLAMDDNNKKLIEPSMLQEIDSLKKEIMSKQIVVSDYYKVHNAAN